MLSHDILTLSHKKTEPYGKIDLVAKEKVIFANVFDIKNYVDIYSEINKVMFYLAVQDCSYNIKIGQFENGMPNNITDLTILASGTYNGEGYLTETLSTPFVFTSESNCVVFIEVIPNSANSEIYFPVENYINVKRNEGESYFCIDPIDDDLCWVDEIESDSNYTGNYCIRPVLKKKSSNHFAELTSEIIIDTTKDYEIEYNSDSYLFNIHTSNNVILRENRDYIKTDSKIIFRSSYLQSLKDNYTEMILEFNNDITKTVIVNPKAKITGVNISGKYTVGETLTVDLVTDVFKDNYDVDYQWQSSIDGLNWYDIGNANTNEYVITNNDFLRYVRVVVKSSSKYGNVEYPSNATSAASKTKCIIIGDTDLDGYVNIDDATKIQKYLADLVEFSEEQVVSADFDSDGIISINDVTAIQKMLVQ